MYGRMVHSGDAADPGDSQRYDNVYGRCIRSVDRAELNRQLLDACEARKNIRLSFGHKLVWMDPDGEDGAAARFDVYSELETVVEDKGKPGKRAKVKTGEHEILVDLVVGTDGAHSKVRELMMRYVQ
jgi:2-polyprenyl-6-methoxyphenol hydroxylase-like FAD-dependent oxidoreductase